MNPWDQKLTHELSEQEMLDFVHYLQGERFFEREEQIKSMVEKALKQWAENRGQPHWQRNHGPFGPGRVRMMTDVSDPRRQASVLSGTYIDFRMMLPEWLDHDQAAVLAEMQIREIFAQNE